MEVHNEAMGTRLALLILAGLALMAPFASAQPGPGHISWADKQHRHGWAFSPDAAKAIVVERNQ